MNVQHFEKNVRYSDKDLLTLARKIGKLATYCKRLKNEDSVIRVEAEGKDTKKERDQVTVMVTVDLPKKQFRAESLKGNAIEALDRCIEKLEPQLKKYKELHTGRGLAHLVSRKAKRA